MPGKTSKSKTDTSGSSQTGKYKKTSSISVGHRPPHNQDDDTITEPLEQPIEDPPGQQRTLAKPDDQLQLTEAELKEEHTRILTATNPHAPQNIIRYSFKERQFKQLTVVDQLAVHFALDGNMIHVESDEARRQLAQTGGAAGFAEAEPSVAKASASHATTTASTEKAEGAEGEGAEGDEDGAREAEAEGKDGEGEGGVDEGALNVGGGGEKKLTNQFNFCERASQTYNNPLRERGTLTEPPPRATYSANVTQWEIFDAYQEDFAKQEKSKEKKATPGKKEDDKKKKTTMSDSQVYKS